ncbi:hypothetical protein [Nostoc sp.]
MKELPWKLQRELFMGETPKTTLAPQRTGSLIASVQELGCVTFLIDRS